MITSRDNAFVKKILKLHTVSGRKKAGRFFTEGVRSIYQALDANAPITDIVYSEGVFSVNGGKELLNRASAAGIRMVIIKDVLFNLISDTKNPQHIMAIIDIKDCDAGAVLTAQSSLFVIADGIRDPGNLGTIIRTADAAGADGVLMLKGTADPYSPKAVRGTMGSIFSVPIIREMDDEVLLNNICKNKIKIIAADRKGNTDYRNADFKGKVGIAIGNEAGGISGRVRACADRCVAIPMPGRAESLNAAIACGILLYKALEQRLT